MLFLFWWHQTLPQHLSVWRKMAHKTHNFHETVHSHWTSWGTRKIESIIWGHNPYVLFCSQHIHLIFLCGTESSPTSAFMNTVITPSSAISMIARRIIGVSALSSRFPMNAQWNTFREEPTLPSHLFSGSVFYRRHAVGLFVVFALFGHERLQKVCIFSVSLFLPTPRFFVRVCVQLQTFLRKPDFFFFLAIVFSILRNASWPDFKADRARIPFFFLKNPVYNLFITKNGS